jgi:hypothetical protein
VTEQDSVIQFVHMPCMEEPTDEDLLKLGFSRQDIADFDALADSRCESRYGLLLLAIDLFVKDNQHEGGEATG